MRLSLIRRAQHARQPMIQFLGQRKNIDHGPHAPAPHPAAPQEIKDQFQSFLSKLQSQSGGADSPSSNPKGQSLESSARGHVRPHGDSAAGGGGRRSDGSLPAAAVETTQGPLASKPADYDFFWEAPEYLWRIREVSERESEAVMSGGATDVRTRI